MSELSPRDEERLADFIRRGGALSLRALPLSCQAWLSLALAAKLPHPMLWITDGPRTLDILFDDVSSLGHAMDLRPAFYPAWESLPGRGAPPPADLVGDRFDVLQRGLRAGTASLLVTCVQALMQRTLSPRQLQSASREWTTGMELDPAHALHELQGQGYDIQPEVSAKGQVAARGDIIDVWPLVSDWPVRVELFGSSIESIRTFDPQQQRSLAHCPAIRLSPAREDAGALEGSLLDYLPPDTVWVWSDREGIRHHAALYEEMVREAGAGRCTLALEEVKERATEQARGVLDFTIMDDPPPWMLDFRPLESMLPPPELAGTPDVLEKRRGAFLALLCQRAAAQWTIDLYFPAEGSRDRFLETYGRNLAPAHAFHYHVGRLSEGFECAGARRMVVTESDFYGRRKEARGRYDPQSRRRGPARLPAERIADWTDIQPGDLVVHVDHGIGKYLGLYEIEFNGELQEVLTIEYAGPAKLYVPVAQSHLLSRYVGVGKARPKLHELGGHRWAKDKVAAEKAVQDLAAALLQTQAMRDALPGHAFGKDTPWQHEFEASFPYQETPDQDSAIAAVKVDMESTRPMDRLICGDVGYGKTEVAMRAAFKAVMDGKQVGLLVPTTILAQQHFDTFTTRMAAYPVRIAMLSRFQTPAQQKDIVARLAEGSLDIVIGTHRLVQRDVRFKDLGLAIIDEEQRFGVQHKEHLKRMRQLVDVLTLTATPIPRTLYMSLTGAKDLSTIQTPPVERMAIETLVVENTDQVVRESILREINREGQVYFLHNRVQTIEKVWERLRRIVPEAKVEMAHGQMPEKQLAAIMRAFVRNDFDVLLCTTIIESGLDIPNVNTILIDRADRFGLAELYQLRGRVGRYKRKAYAYLLLPKHMALFDQARKRIHAIKRYSHLGSGFRLAMRDLEIRGAGNILGSEQSGHIAAVGFDLYCQLLRRTVAVLRKQPLPPIVDVEVKLDFINLSPGADLEETGAALPVRVVEDESQRVHLYRKLAGASTEPELAALQAEVRDRFGRMPPAVDRLFRLALLRIVAAARRITRIEVQDGKVLLTRRGDLVTINNRLPRLRSARATDQLDELLKLVRGLP